MKWFRRREKEDPILTLARRVLTDWALACRVVDRMGLEIVYLGRGYGVGYPAWSAQHRRNGNVDGSIARTPMEAVAYLLGGSCGEFNVKELA